MDINENGLCTCLECGVELSPDLMYDRGGYEICGNCLRERGENPEED